MLAVISSDWHPDFYMMGVSRFKEVEKAVNQTVECAIDEKADAYLFLGDLSDPDTGGETFLAVNLMLQTLVRLTEAKIQSILIAGNHDVCTDGTGATTLTPLRAFEAAHPAYVSIVEEPNLITIGNLQSKTQAFMCLPYTAPSHAYNPVEYASTIMQKAKEEYFSVIVLGHLMIDGIHPGSETKEMPRGREIAFPVQETTDALMRFNGHIHKRQNFDPGDGGPKIRIPGSLCRLGFTEEENEPSFLLVNF